MRSKERLIKMVNEFIKIPKGQKIADPMSKIEVGIIPMEITTKLGINTRNTVITRKAVKHIVERQGILAKDILTDIDKTLRWPTKIVDNVNKRANSYLFARMNGKAKALILEIKKGNQNEIVSAFYVDKKTYAKLKDISGRADVPPSP